MKTLTRLAGVVALTCACAAQPAPPTDDDVAHREGLSWDAFRAEAWREPFEGGVWIVDGDVPVPNERLLRELWAARHGGGDALIVHQAGGADARWSAEQAHALTYCVSTGFGSRYAEVVAAMEAAAGAWEEAADVDFVHLEEEDARCTASNERVLFDVRAVSGQRYLARAFFPHQSRATRNVLVDASSFTTTTPGLTLTGILRHELGHALGFRHEHTRPESGRCYEDASWRALTGYDRASVMHYPHCNGTGDWSLELTDDDRGGAAALYGAPDEEPPPAPPAVGSSHRVFVAEGEARVIGPFAVMPETSFVATTRGVLGDADLYVRFDAVPAEDGAWDCRPLADGGDEDCHLDVPPGAELAFVAVRSHAGPAAASLEVAYTGPAFAGVVVDDLGRLVAFANEASLETLDDEVGLDARAAANIVAERPLADFAALDAVPWVGPAALAQLHAFANAPSEEALILEFANTARFEVLDLEVGLDRRAAEGIVAGRPFATLEALDAVPWVGPSALEALRVWATGGGTPPTPEPTPTPGTDEARILEVANTASFEVLDVHVGLDVRAARGIVEQRPFATLEELDAVPWVGPSALDALLAWANR
ncbi:MAG TPA: matrixin family metalloprotease [Polyangiaceae bacterium LLY-WYZ-15_(1-7)]|nr:matrixin family metalloprotease [Polyangiaceae bacterium LLY-WYZ-15_(1-7)]